MEESDGSTEDEIESSDTESEYLSDSDDGIFIDEHLRKDKYRWRKTKPPIPDMDFVGDQFRLPPKDFENLSPHDIFLQFWSDEIIKLTVEQTNQYGLLKKEKSVNTNFAEIEQFLGIQTIMGIVQMSAYTNYWAAETRVNITVNTMSRKWHKELRGSIHLVDNTLQD